MIRVRRVSNDTRPTRSGITWVAEIPRRGYHVDDFTRPPSGLAMTVDAASLGAIVIDDTLQTFRKAKELAERALAQVDDTDFFRTIDPESNSIAILVKHIGGNLLSRWTDFLTTDGEKPTRNRDGEFVVPDDAGRDEIMALWTRGWAALFAALTALRPDDLVATVTIRNESMPAVAAMHRGLGHIAQHIGQIVLLAKHYRSADWKTLSIPRGRSGDWQSTTPPTR